MEKPDFSLAGAFAGAAARKAANVAAEKNWNSGDSDKQNLAIGTWMSLVSSGDIDAIQSLQTLINQGVQAASGALFTGLSARAKYAAMRKKSDVAELLVSLHNNGWGEATNAIRVVLLKRKGARGKKKYGEVVKLFADAGFAPAVEFLNGNEEALTFGEVIRQWGNPDNASAEIPVANQALDEASAEANDDYVGTPVDAALLPLRLQTVKLALESGGRICESRKDTTNEELFLMSPLAIGSDMDGTPIRIYSTGQCLNLIMPVLDLTEYEEADRFVATVACNTVNGSIDVLTFLGICKLDGQESVVAVQNESLSESVDGERIQSLFIEYMEQADGLIKKLIAFYEMLA